MRITPPSSRTDPARQRIRRSPTSPSARRPAKSKPARQAARIGSASTTSCCVSKRNSGPRRCLPAARPSARPQDDQATTHDQMVKLVLLRHGESTWNKENRFTGWTDVDLSDKGKEEAKKDGELLKREGFIFDIAYTSVLKRAIRTLWTVLDEMDLMWIPVIRNW